MKIITQSGVARGRMNQAKQDSPNTFGTESGADQVTQRKLDKPKQRMAGQLSHRLMEYMNDPVEQERTDSWMSVWTIQSGYNFNQAKIMERPLQDNMLDVRRSCRCAKSLFKGMGKLKSCVLHLMILVD